jgi:hypothetical protein
MDKGIRPAAIAKFRELAPSRVAGTLSNTQFRKNVMASIMEDFGITLASAATHYNHAFIDAKKSAPELVLGLGRPEDKKGGRKKKVAPVDMPASDSTFALGIPAPEATLVSEGVKENTSTQTTEVNPEAPALFSVRKKSDGTVVAEGLSLDDANALVAKAKQAKKAALELVA